MPVPVWILLGFAAWTLLSLLVTVGVYRWSRILSGRASIREWRADLSQGSERYQRAMRAHANCVENLVVYAAVVMAMLAAGVQAPLLDVLAVVLMLSRIGQTVVHVALDQTEAVAAVRFALFFIQLICMLWMGAYVAVSAW